MENSILTKINYPSYELPILEHFGGFYESALIAFNPFFVISEESLNYKSSKSLSGSVKLTKDHYNKDELSKVIEYDSNIEIYRTNDNYPEDRKIINSSRVVTWRDLKNFNAIKTYSEMNIGLLTNIGALKKEYQRKDIAKRINNYCINQNIWQPGEGFFSPVVKLEMIRIFQLNGYEQIILQDEFGNSRTKFNLADENITKFIVDSFTNDFKSVYSPDKKILFTIDWDSFFFLICSTKTILKQILTSSLIEGFFCESNTSHKWYLTNRF